MSYQIDAYLKQGVPSIRLFDACSGEERLCWQQPMSTDEKTLKHAWQVLFRRLVLLSSADGITTPQFSVPAPNVKRKRISAPGAAYPCRYPERSEPHTQGNVIYLSVMHSGVGR